MKKLILLTCLTLMSFSFRQTALSWVAIGDSITYLNEHPDEAGNRITKGYMTRVVEKLPNIGYTNKGYNGWTAAMIADQFDQLGIGKADIYTVFLGTNDWWAGIPVGTFADYQQNTGSKTVYGSFRIIIDKLRTLNPDAHIVLITPMQRTDFVYWRDMQNNAYGSYKEKNGQQLAQVVDAIIQIGAAGNMKVIDLYHQHNLRIDRLVKFKRLKDPQTGQYQNYRYPSYTHIPFYPGKDAYPYPPEAVNVTYDGLHPSDKGFGIIAGKIVAVFRKF